MSKLTDFQELRDKCAKLYAPADWPISLWTAFFGDCLDLHLLDAKTRSEMTTELAKAYSCSRSLVVKTMSFQKDNKMIND